MKRTLRLAAAFLACTSWTPATSASPKPSAPQPSPPPQSDIGAHAMTNARLASIFGGLSGELQGDVGRWSFVYRDVRVYCVTDETNDRMRLVAPIVEQSDVDEATMTLCMEANFDRALDARYCLYDGYLWSAFIHPLAELSEEYLRSGLDQVVTLVLTYGTSYTSGALQFGGER